jgi:TRAP-type C4-dicarboxylate transport system permease small subunit
LTTYLISTAVCALTAWQAFGRTGEYLTSTLGTRSDVLGIPFAPFMLAMGIGFCWAGIIFFLELVQTVIGVFKR